MITAIQGVAAPAADRQSLRKLMLERRRLVALGEPERLERLRGHLQAWLERAPAACIGFYRPIRAEPDLTELLWRWKSESAGRRLCVPVIDDLKTGRMHYGLWEKGQEKMGAYRILEPETDVPVEPDLIFSPCVGVTAEGFRLGNGGGFFDRWMAARRRGGVSLVSVAVAYECLMTEAFSPMPYDEPMDWILTESGMRRAETKRAAPLPAQPASTEC